MAPGSARCSPWQRAEPTIWPRQSTHVWPPRVAHGATQRSCGREPQHAGGAPVSRSIQQPSTGRSAGVLTGGMRLFRLARRTSSGAVRRPSSAMNGRKAASITDPAGSNGRDRAWSTAATIRTPDRLCRQSAAAGEGPAPSVQETGGKLRRPVRVSGHACNVDVPSMSDRC